MNINIQEGREQAIALLRKACTPQGLVASIIAADNYKRVWARDAVISGFAGLLANDSEVIEGLKASLLTLMDGISINGYVPSNVDIHNNKKSYGSLAGRVDADTWFLIGCALYYNHTKDSRFLSTVRSSVDRIFETLQHWEYNGRNLLYTPLSGNWADEYPLHGYLLYDNVLWMWSLTLWAEISGSKTMKEKSSDVKWMILTNLWPKVNDEKSSIYHPRLHAQLVKEKREYFIAGFNPGQAYSMFDCAGNALALITGLYDNEKLKELVMYIDHLFDQLGEPFIPAFWPPIFPGENLWHDIENNYSYEFKNVPHHFHNGGIWPVMMGLFVYGLRKNSMEGLADKILARYTEIGSNEHWQFSEYISSDNFVPGGKTQLCFSAAGMIFASTSPLQSQVLFQ